MLRVSCVILLEKVIIMRQRAEFESDEEYSAYLVPEVTRMIEEGDKTIDAGGEATIVVGITGAGKSTLVNYLTGKKLISKLGRDIPELAGGMVDDEYFICLDGEGASIGHAAGSQTTIPNKVMDPAAGKVFWDCPGFRDNRGTSIEIVNAYYIKKLLTDTARLKVLVAINADHLSSTRFTETLNEISDLMNLFGDFNTVKTCISLVVTHAKPTITKTNVANTILLKEKQLHATITTAQSDMLKFLANPEKILLSPKATESGPLASAPRASMLTNLDHIQYSSAGEAHLVISDTAKLHILSLFSRTSSNISGLFGEFMSYLLHVQKSEISTGSYEAAVNIALQIQSVNDKLIAAGRNDIEVMRYIQAIAKSYNTNGKAAELISKINIALFFKDLDPEHCETEAAADAMEVISLQAVREVEDAFTTELNRIKAEVLTFVGLKAFEVAEKQSTLDEDIVKLKKLKALLEAPIRDVHSSSDFLEVLSDIEVLGIFDENTMRGLAERFIQISGLKFANLQNCGVNAFLTILQQNMKSSSDLLVEKVKTGVLHAVHDAFMGYIDNLDIHGGLDITDKRLIDIHQSLTSFLGEGHTVEMPEFLRYFYSMLEDSNTAKEILDQFRWANWTGLPVSVERSSIANLVTKVQESEDWYKAVRQVYKHMSTTQSHGIAVINADNFYEILQESGVDNCGTLECNFKRLEQLKSIFEHSWADHPRVTQANDYESVTVSGSCVSVSDVIPHIRAHTKFIKIQASNTVLFDESVDAPSKNFIVYAPIWKVVGDVRINLHGIDAPELVGLADIADATGFKADGKSGADGGAGRPGLPGGNGGNFYGSGVEFIGFEQLQIDTSGGAGSAGQKGGNGANGTAGNDASRSSYSACAGVQYTGFPGGSGGDAGAGGAGGLGGKAGKIDIFKGTYRQVAEFFTADDGQTGLDGVDGTPGVGGKNGNDYYYHTYTTTHSTGGKNPTSYTNSHVDQYVIPKATLADNGAKPTEKNMLGREEPLDQSQILFELKFHALSMRSKLNELSGSSLGEFYQKLEVPLIKQFITQMQEQEVLPEINTGGTAGGMAGEGTDQHEVGSYWYVYTREGVIDLLKLRLEHAGLKDIKIVCPDYIWDGSNALANKIAIDITTAVREKAGETSLVVLNLYGKHWVGLIVEHTGAELMIRYMDPEQKQMPESLLNALRTTLQNTFSELQVNIVSAELELQHYNNCGPEVIEDFMEYLTDTRVAQKDVTMLHSMLYEDLVV